MYHPHLLRLIITLLLTACLSWLTFSYADVDDDDDEEMSGLPKIKLTKAKDLASLGALASSRKLPILIMFSMDGCDFCERMEQNYLIPMLRSGEYEDKVIIRMVKVDDYGTLRDFDGGSVASRDLPDRYGAVVTPTLVFLDSYGKELAPRIIGVGTEGFFAGEIDDAIDLALRRL